jgi:hypothetical protein
VRTLIVPACAASPHREQRVDARLQVVRRRHAAVDERARVAGVLLCVTVSLHMSLRVCCETVCVRVHARYAYSCAV